MTNKEFFEKVIKANISAEVTDKAAHLLELANGRTSKRAEKTTANQAENLKIFKAIADILNVNTTYAVSEVKTLLNDTEYKDLSTSKLSAIFKIAVDNGLANVISGYKAGGKGRAVKGYTILAVDEVDEVDETTEE